MSVLELSLLEIFILELIAWVGIWLYNDYLATLLTSIVTAIVFSILVIAAISEKIERSKVPRKYFGVMLISVLAPLVAAAIYVVMNGGVDFLPGLKD